MNADEARKMSETGEYPAARQSSAWSGAWLAAIEKAAKSGRRMVAESEVDRLRFTPTEEARRLTFDFLVRRGYQMLKNGNTGLVEVSW